MILAKPQNLTVSGRQVNAVQRKNEQELRNLQDGDSVTLLLEEDGFGQQEIK